MNTESSPQLIHGDVSSLESDSVEEQYVQVRLTFDSPVDVDTKKKKNIRMTIGDKRVKDDEYQLEKLEEDTVLISIHVNSITTGILKISPVDENKGMGTFTDESGRYDAKPFEFEAVIPSGVMLSPASPDPEHEMGIVQEVTSSYYIRSIAWIRIREGNLVIDTGEENSQEYLDGAVAVHGHDYLIEDEESTAANMVEVLQKNFGEEYEFLQDGEKIHLWKKNGDPEGDLELEVYGYVKIDGEERAPLERESGN